MKSILVHFDRARAYLLGGGLGPLILRAAAGSSAVQAAAMVLTFLMGILLARGLGVEGYGHYGIAMAVAAIASIPAELGLPKLVTREVAASAARKDLPGLFGILRWSERAAYIMSAVAVAAVVAGTLLVFGWPPSPLATAILWGVPAIPLVALGRTRGAALQGLQFLVLGQIPATLIRPLLFSVLLLILFLAMPEASAADAMALNVVTAAVALYAAQRWLRPRLPRADKVTPRIDGRSWLKSSIPIALANGVLVLQLQLTVLLVGILSTPAEVGYFRIATSIMTAVGLPLLLMNMVTSPVLARLHAESDHRRLQHLCTRAAQGTALGTLALTLPLLLWGSFLIGFVFGEEFTPALPTVILLCLGSVVVAAFGPSTALLVMSGHEQRVTRASFVALLVNIALLFVLVPAWHSVGAAVAMGIGSLTWNLLAWNDARRLLGVETSLLPTRTAATSATS